MNKNIQKNIHTINNKTIYLKYVFMIFSVLSLQWKTLENNSINTQSQLIENFDLNNRSSIEDQADIHEDIAIVRISSLTKAQFENHLLIEVNKHRIDNSLPPLKLNRKLCDVAQSHADYMATDNYGHASANGDSGTDRIKNSPYNDDKDIFCAWENIAYWQRTIRKVVTDEWMNSSGHRANILNPDFKEMGIAYKKWTYTSSRWGKYEWLYFVQTFWTLK